MTDSIGASIKASLEMHTLQCHLKDFISPDVAWCYKGTSNFLKRKASTFHSGAK